MQVGQLYSQDKLAARVRGAALVSSNIAGILTSAAVAARPPDWRPLVGAVFSAVRCTSDQVYCWRGGQRSRALALVLQEVGWQPALLEGGYKSVPCYTLLYCTVS